MLKLYMLKGKIVVQANSLMEWANWMTNKGNRVARTEVDDITISTVFLGLDHNWTLKNDPLLFETMVFSPDQSGLQWRYFTYQEAENGHQEIVEAIKAHSDEMGHVAADVIHRLKAKSKMGE